MSFGLGTRDQKHRPYAGRRRAMRPCGRIILVIFTFLTSFILVNPLSGPFPAWSADYSKQPVQRSPGIQPAFRAKAPWQPITPHANSFEENHALIQDLVREIEAKTGIEATARSVRGQKGRMDKLQKILTDLREDLQEILNELAAVSSLIREAAMADRSRNIVRSEGKQLVYRLEAKLPILEDKRAGLINRINMLEKELSTISNMNQLDRVNLQNTSQKVNQLYHLLSTVMKNQHEIASAIVRNMI